MNRKEMIERIERAVNGCYNYFKEKVMVDKEEIYCEEMALMYNLRKYLQYITYEEKGISDKMLKVFINNIGTFIDDLLDIYWKNDLGNSYGDITIYLKEIYVERVEWFLII